MDTDGKCSGENSCPVGQYCGGTECISGNFFPPKETKVVVKKNIKLKCLCMH